MKKKILGISLVSLLLVVFIGSISINYKSKNNIVKIEDLEKTKGIAFYKAKEDGTYEETNTMPTSGYKLNEEKSICSNGAKVSLNMSDYSLNIANLNGHTNCYLYFDEDIVKIGDVKFSNKGEYTEFTGIATAEDTGIYSAPDDYGTSYYFRGLEGSLNNWVKFADSYWRIIRVNGNGTIRMIYSGAANGLPSSSNKTGATTQIGTSMYNHTYNDNAYVGYMMGIPLNGTTQTANKTSNNSTSYEQAHTNTYDSDAKIQLDNWYRINIEDKGLSKYVDINTGFCNDREVMSGVSSYYGILGYGNQATSYAPWGRVYKNTWLTTQAPILQCFNKSRDLFTYTSTNEGNNKLIYPVGTITSDEVVFVGGFAGTDNLTYYLYTNQQYWTMSPCSSGNASLFFVYSNGSLLSGVAYDTTSGLRPVINLRADTQFTGEGSETSPFEVVVS